MFSLRKTLFSLPVAAVLMFLAVGAQANTLHVAADGSGDFTSIQVAINAANTGDTVLVAAGTYHESLNWASNDLTFQGAGAGQSIIDPSTANGGPGGRCLYTTQLSSASIISGFTFQNGRALNNDGGGICNFTSSPTVTNCTFIGNNADGGGGGMYNYSSNPTITNCTFIGNQVSSVYGDGAGGGIYNFTSSPTITNCTFNGNWTIDNGGGMSNFSHSSPTITNCTFSNNSAPNTGAGMFNYNSSNPTLTNCTFSDNLSTYDGAGIYNYYYSSPTLTNCILWGNAGGGIYNDYFCSPTVSYSDVQDFSNAMPDANGNFAADPLFVRNPGGNGASDFGDLHLQWGSPAIDVGNDAAVIVPPFPANLNGQPLDLDGNPRISRAHVDLGAYEYQNLAPIVNAGGNQTVTAAHTGNPATDTASLSLNGSATDPENDPLTYTWTDANGNVVGNSLTLMLTLHLGAYTYTLTANAPFGASGHQSVLITVNPAPNQAPSANSQNLSLNQDTSANITLDGSDPDGDAITYAIATNPAHGTLSGTVPNLTYTPNSGFAGSDSFTFTVSDPYGAASASATISLTVKDTTPPVITLNGSNPMTVNQGSTFTDPGATAVDNVDGSVPVTVSGSVNTAVPGPYTLTYSAQDSAGNKATATRTVNVVAVAPKVTVKLTAIGELLGVVGVVVTVQNSGSATINNVKITSASLIDVKAALILPNGFSLGAGKSQDVALAFYPLKKGQKGTLSISGSYSGGTFSLEQSVTIP